MVRALDAFSIKMSERERHAAMGTNIAHGRHLALAVAADQNRLPQYDL
jgi:hypothetical protein